MTTGTKEKKLSKKEQQKKAKEEQVVQEAPQEAVSEAGTSQQISMADLISWDDEKCLSSKITVPIIQVRNILREAATTQSNYEVLRAVLLKGDMTGYFVECPQCHKTSKVSPHELKRDGNVTCPDCECSYNQLRCIKGIVTIEDEKEDA